MHWLKLLTEVWVAFGIVTIVAGLIWTTRLSREMKTDLGKVAPTAERQFASPSLSKLHSA